MKFTILVALKRRKGNSVIVKKLIKIGAERGGFDR